MPRKSSYRTSSNIPQRIPKTIGKGPGSTERRYRVSKGKSGNEGEDIKTYSTFLDNREPIYEPVQFEIPKEKQSILKTTPDVTLIDEIPYPQLSYGFHHRIHTNKDKMEIKHEFDDKKKVYLVINEFEDVIDDHKKGIASEVQSELGVKSVESRSFYEVWELLMTYRLLIEESYVDAISLGNDNGSLQAVSVFRSQYAKKNTKDKYYKAEIDDIPFKKSTLSDKKITNIKANKLKSNADLVISHINYEWKNDNSREQESFRAFIESINVAVNNQSKGGSFICKINDLYTSVSAKILALLGEYYENIFIHKPFMSRLTETDRYIVATGFKFKSEKELNSKNAILEKLIKAIRTKKNAYIENLFSDYNVSLTLRAFLIMSNDVIANKMVKTVNAVVRFVESHNYRGDVYQYHRELQIKASKFWVDSFLPTSKSKLKDAVIKLKQLSKDTLKKYEKKAEQVKKLQDSS